MPMWVEDKNLGYCHLKVPSGEVASQKAQAEVADDDLLDPKDGDDDAVLPQQDRRSRRKSTQDRAFQAADADDDEPEASHMRQSKEARTSRAAETKQTTLTQHQGVKRTLSLQIREQQWGPQRVARCW